MTERERRVPLELWEELRAHGYLRLAAPAEYGGRGIHQDRFERRDGRWRFVERRVRTDLVGDVSRHLRSSAVEP